MGRIADFFRKAFFSGKCAFSLDTIIVNLQSQTCVTVSPRSYSPSSGLISLGQFEHSPDSGEGVGSMILWKKARAACGFAFSFLGHHTVDETVLELFNDTLRFEEC